MVNSNMGLEGGRVNRIVNWDSSAFLEWLENG